MQALGHFQRGYHWHAQDELGIELATLSCAKEPNERKVSWKPTTSTDNLIRLKGALIRNVISDLNSDYFLIRFLYNVLMR